MSTPATAEEKIKKKNDVKARGLLLMALPNEHQLTFSQYPDAKSMFAAIETRFGGNAATKKTQKTLLKQQYENFSATSAESLDSIFNRLQKIVSRLAILGVIIAQEDLNLKFLSSLPPEWNTHVEVPISQTTMENGITTLKMSTPATAEEKIKKKNDVKARGLLFMALPNEHQLTFSQYPDAKSMFAAIETRFGESLDSIFNRLQKIVSRLAILGVIIAQEDLNLKILSSLPPEWNTHVVVWMNKPEIETMSIDDFYNNFKIVKQKIKKTVGTSSGGQNLAFMTAPSSSSINDANTAYSQVSSASPSVNTVSPQVCTVSVSDNTVYAFMVENLNGSNVLHQDLEQIHEDDLEAMDLKWQLSLLSMREKKYYQKTCKKIFINRNDLAGYDKSKVECYNFHKLGHFARECRASRSKEDQFRNQDNTRKQGNKEDTSKAVLAIDGVGFDWSDMAEEQKQYDDLLAKQLQTKFESATYKRGLDAVEAQLVTYRKNEDLFSEELVVLKREVGIKQYEINTLKTEFEKLKQEKDAFDFKIEKFDKASKDID
ncbi:putative ribonuclease H-like domain-containing protein [Tanacetum coccineum]